MNHLLKQYLPLLLLPCLFLGVGSCKKEIAKAGLSITGKYRQLYYGYPNTRNSYYVFNDNNTYTWYYATGNEAHISTQGVFQPDGNSLLLSESISRMYLVEQSGDTLKLLYKPNEPYTGNENIILVKDESIPPAEQWIKSVTPITSLPVPLAYMDGITFLNSEVWSCRQFENYLRSYSPVTGRLSISLPVSQYYLAIEAQGGNLWGLSAIGSKLKKINPATGAEIFTSVSAGGGTLTSLASDGTKIYCFTDAGALYVYDIASDTFTPGGYFFSVSEDIACAGGFLYSYNSQSIYKVDPVTLNVVSTYRLNGVAGYFRGIAFDGTSFWVYLGSSGSDPDQLVKVNLD